MSAPLSPLEALRLLYDVTGHGFGDDYLAALDKVEATLEAFEVQS